MPDEPKSSDLRTPTESSFAAALAQLLVCETLAQTSAWAARWLARIAGADAALVWTTDPIHPAFTCTGATGEGIGRVLQQSVPRGEGIVWRLVRDREPFALTAAELLVANDPWLPPSVRNFGVCLALPLEAEDGVIGAAAVFFRDKGA